MITIFKSKFARGRTALMMAAALSVVAQVWAQEGKPGGLPGDHIVSDRWRHSYSKYSGITNAAFINEENYMALRILFANTMRQFDKYEVGFTMPLDLYSAAGLSWVMQGPPAFMATDGKGDPTSFKVVDQSHFIALSYANNVWGGLTVGGNINIMYLNIPIPGEEEGAPVGHEARIGIGADIGFTYKVLRHQLLGNHIVGLSTNNIFNMFLGTEEEQYIAALRLSLLSDFWERRISYGADFVLKDFLAADRDWPDANDVREAPWEFSQKLGFNVLRIFKMYVLAGFSSAGFDHYGFAFGANFPGFFNGRDIEGMMQFVSIAGTPEDASHITFYFRSEFGPHREEVFARKMARRGMLGPNNLYNQALRLYFDGEYYRAYWMFSQIAIEYPDFFRNDMVSYYQAACLEGMDMRQSAVGAFRRTKEEHSRSTAVYMADLGLMRVFYRGADYSGVESQFEELNTLGVPDSIKFHGYYLMGQTAVQRGDYNRARQLFTMIPENHPDYIFSYLSAAVANVHADNIQGAIADLEFVIQIQPKNKAQEEAINRAFVFLGYLYYEDLATEGALARAVTALRRVPRTSYYHQDALLGLGWTALKARQWVDCSAAGAELTRATTDPVLQSEGLLIQAYAQAMQKNYRQAVTMLDEAMKKLSGFTPPNESELGAKQNEYQDTRSQYESVGTRIDELGQARQSSVVQASIDSLQGPQNRMKTSIDEHFKFVDDFKRRSFFSRTYEQVKEDIEYALARFTRHASPRGGGGTSGDMEDELERLRRELEGE